MEETISLREVIHVIRKRFLLIVSLIVCLVVVIATLSYVVLTPVYETNTQFIVNQNQQLLSNQGGLDSGTIKTNVELINTYSVIIKSKAILGNVLEELELKRSINDLNEQIDISSEENSQVVTVTVTDSDLETAVDIANTTVAVFKDTIKDIMNVDNVSVLSEAEIEDNVSPVNPKPILNIAVAIVVGAMIGISLSLLIEYLDTKVRTEEDIEEKLDVPVIGSITSIKQRDVITRRADIKNKAAGGESGVKI